MDAHRPSMTTEPGGDDELMAEANRLYWGSGAGVNAIADRLNLSKSALYALVRPLDAGRDCPACGGAMAYPHRTARDSGVARCSACEVEEGADTTEGSDATKGAPASPGLVPPAPSGPSARTLVAGALLGAAAGLALLSWVRRRR